jgi:hypothetical protein
MRSTRCARRTALRPRGAPRCCSTASSPEHARAPPGAHAPRRALPFSCTNATGNAVAVGAMPGASRSVRRAGGRPGVSGLMEVFHASIVEVFSCASGGRRSARGGQALGAHAFRSCALGPSSRRATRSVAPAAGRASGHACVGGAARFVLEDELGDRGFEVTLTGPNGASAVYTYTAWKQITDDVDDARIFGGIHFRFDQEAGARLGRRVGRFIRHVAPQIARFRRPGWARASSR